MKIPTNHSVISALWLLVFPLWGCTNSFESTEVPDTGDAKEHRDSTKDTGSPIDTGSASDTDSAIDSGFPNDTNSPIDTGSPTDSGSPNDTNSPIDTGSASDTDSATDVDSDPVSCGDDVAPGGGIPRSSPHSALRRIPLKAVRWNDGFMKQQWNLVKNAMIHTLWENYTQGHGNYYVNFQNAASGTGEYQNSTNLLFADGDFYKWMEAVSYVIAVTGDPTLTSRLEDIIETIDDVQQRAQTMFGYQNRGYINTYNVITGRAPITQNGDWSTMGAELYNIGHLLSAGAAHYEATGDDRLLNIAQKAGDYLVRIWNTYAGAYWDHAVILGAYDLYETTGVETYRQLAQNIVDRKGNPVMDDNVQGRVPFVEESVAVGHAQRANYLYAGAANVYMENGDPAYLAALDRIWTNVINHQMYITGGTGSVHGVDWHNPVPGEPPSSIRGDHVEEAYGPNDYLPNTSAYNEGCASAGMVLWSWNMLNIHGEEAYAEILERELMNAIPAGYSRSGDAFFYTNPLRRLKHSSNPTYYSMDSWKRTRTSGWTGSGNDECQCCPPNYARIVAMSSKMAYSVPDANELWVHLYGSNTLRTQFANGRPVAVTQFANDYPWDGHVQIRIDTPGHFAVKVRVPKWAEGTTIRVNGSTAADSVTAGSYFEIAAREWNCGDTITIDLPMEVRYVPGNPNVDDQIGRVAVMRGPVVYAAESIDLPMSIDAVGVGPSNDWTVTMDPSVGGARLDDPGSDIGLIPYFGWNNRGDHDMVVWLLGE